MGFDEFINKYNGKGIDYDGSFGNQCVDLYRQYVKEVLGAPQSPPVPSAKNIWDTYLPQYFTRITNTPTGVPAKGDIVIWGTGIGADGHVAIATDGNVNTFNSFDQNFPVGSLCHIQNHSYKGVLGWLKFKGQTDQAAVIADLKRQIAERDQTISSLKDKIEKAKQALA